MIDFRDTAAAGADLHQLDDRNQERQAAAALEAPCACRFEPVRMGRLTVVDITQLCGGPAHVERQRTLDADGPCEIRGRKRPRSGPRLDDLYRHRARNLRTRDAAVRKHHLQRPPQSHRGELPVEHREVVAHERTHVGVAHGGGCTLSLANLRRDVARDRAVELGKLTCGERFHRLLVNRIAIGVQQAHCDRVHAGSGERAQRFRTLSASSGSSTRPSQLRRSSLRVSGAAARAVPDVRT